MQHQRTFSCVLFTHLREVSLPPLKSPSPPENGHLKKEVLLEPKKQTQALMKKTVKY